jgi:hypothetical protein
MIEKFFVKPPHSTIAMLAFLMILMSDNAQTQERVSRQGLALGAGLGYGRAGIAVGQQSNNQTGVALHGRIGVGVSDDVLLLLAAEIQPFKVENPARAEAYSSFSVLPSLQIYLSQAFYFRPGLGLQFRSWSGEDPVTGSDSGPAAGLAIGYEFRLSPGLALAPELVGNWSIIESEGNVTASFYGIQLTVSR